MLKSSLPANEVFGFQHAVNLTPDFLEELGSLDSLDEVVLSAFLLDDIAGLVAEHADLLVGVLT